MLLSYVTKRCLLNFDADDSESDDSEIDDDDHMDCEEEQPVKFIDVTAQSSEGY